MSTLFTFLHHLCAFTLVSALAIEFTLIKQELTLASARRLQTTDLVLGIAAGLLLVIGLAGVLLREGACILLAQPRVPDQVQPVRHCRTAVDHSDHGIFVLARCDQGGGSAGVGDLQAQARHDGHSCRVGRGCHHPVVRRDHGARRMGLG